MCDGECDGGGDGECDGGGGVCGERYKCSISELPPSSPPSPLPPSPLHCPPDPQEPKEDSGKSKTVVEWRPISKQRLKKVKNNPQSKQEIRINGKIENSIENSTEDVVHKSITITSDPPEDMLSPVGAHSYNSIHPYQRSSSIEEEEEEEEEEGHLYAGLEDSESECESEGEDCERMTHNCVCLLSR